MLKYNTCVILYMVGRNKMDPSKKKKYTNIILGFIILFSIIAIAYIPLVYFEREKLIEQIKENEQLEMTYFKFQPERIIGSNLLEDGTIQINFGNGTSVPVCFDMQSTFGFFQNDTHYQCHANSELIKAGKQ